MTGDQITAGNTICRYCGRSKLSEDGYPTASAYMLSQSDRDHNPPYLSFNWLEYFSRKKRASQLNAIRDILEKKMKVAPQAMLALLPVKEIHREFEEARENTKVDIQHLPENTSKYDDPTHCGFFIDIDSDEGVVAQLLAQVSCAMEPAKSS